MDIAGVVLGVIPLVVKAIEFYRDEKGPAKAMRQWKGRLITLLRDLKGLHFEFLTQIVNLLRFAKLAYDDLDEMQCIEILSDIKLTKAIEKMLGKRYARCLEILGLYEDCLKKIITKIDRIGRLEGAKMDDVRALIGANPSVRGRFDFPRGIAFAWNQKYLNNLLEDMKEAKRSLKEFVEGLETRQSHYSEDPSQEAVTIAHNLAEVQTTAIYLFNALCKGCNCATRHGAMARLENRLGASVEMIDHSSRITAERTLYFSLVLPIDDTKLQHVLVNAFRSEQMANTALNSSTDLSGVSSIRREVTELCLKAREAWQGRQHLTLDLAVGVLSVPTTSTTSPNMRTHSPHLPKPVMLESLLSESSEKKRALLVPKQQTVLALDIASSILQFRQTRWLSSPWSSRTIRLVELVNQNTKRSFLVPFIEELLEPDDPMQEIDPCDALVELAILLLEIWHNETFEAWATRTSTDLSTLDYRRLAASKWLKSPETESNVPLHYLKAIEQCLTLWIGRSQSWDDNEFWRYYCENIILPLVESCKAWIRQRC
ncbi:hypothetical protein QBC40DRAFT_316372 [Triangularia verruculosa]|uniref:DUF7580 domain-containing protein n=1 Tax=Triangularia verruculosa TaxID=2587418 RepID=A0AAN6XQ03_9PEZI|nr:hypothetical protein QBC40DRAFT_316372 [Triangularia verruculosa]